MELFFNELSTEPLAKDLTEATEKIRNYIQTYKEAISHHFKGIRYLHSFDRIRIMEDLSLQEFCNLPQSRTLTSLLLGLARYPFIDENSLEEKRYIQSSFYLQRGEKKMPCHGLAAAYLYESLGINILSSTEWGELVYKLCIEGEEEGEKNILSISSPAHCGCETFLAWKEGRSSVELMDCPLPPGEKKICLRDDHGKDLLIKFAQRLVTSPYVVSIVNSLPYNPKERKFVRNVTVTGLVEIVLTDTDKGLGVVVQTTGKTLRQTQEIAKLLEKEFGK